MAASTDLFRIGQITFSRSDRLGLGCDGTTVYRGSFGTVPAAVKRVLLHNVSIVEQEIKTVSKATHRNILRYLATEKDNAEYCYIALELCARTLSEYVKNELDVGRTSDLDILRQATEGLDYLHSLEIIQRDIKPQNILLTYKSDSDEVVVKIADFGFCKPLKEGHSSISMSDVRGTNGWMAPEVIKDSQERITTAIDIFALGCVFYFVLSRGSHPFGTGTNWLRLQINITKGEASLEGDDEIAKNLIQKMIDNDPENRLSLKQVLSHAFFSAP